MRERPFLVRAVRSTDRTEARFLVLSDTPERAVTVAIARFIAPGADSWVAADVPARVTYLGGSMPGVTERPMLTPDPA